MKYIDWKETDPELNLAFEEYIFNEMNPNENYFLLWQNDNGVIVGKHQNTIEEINLDYINENNIKVVRRLSGGGAVYHDMGNLNFSIIVNDNGKEPFDFKRFTRPVILALQSLGVDAKFNSRNDITVEGKKFSGNAQYAKKGRILHHGTILFNSKLSTVENALMVRGDKIESKGIKSIKSRVTNISDYLETSCTLDEFKKILVNFTFEEETLEKRVLSENDLKEIEKLRTEKYGTWDWNFGKSPEYNLRKDRKYDFGLVTLLLQVEKGTIKSFRVFGDYFGDGESKELESLLVGVSPEKSALKSALKEVDIKYYINGLDRQEFIDLILY